MTGNNPLCADWLEGHKRTSPSFLCTPLGLTQSAPSRTRNSSHISSTHLLVHTDNDEEQEDVADEEEEEERIWERDHGAGVPVGEADHPFVIYAHIPGLRVAAAAQPLSSPSIDACMMRSRSASAWCRVYPGPHAPPCAPPPSQRPREPVDVMHTRATRTGSTGRSGGADGDAEPDYFYSPLRRRRPLRAGERQEGAHGSITRPEVMAMPKAKVMTRAMTRQRTVILEGVAARSPSGAAPVRKARGDRQAGDRGRVRVSSPPSRRRVARDERRGIVCDAVTGGEAVREGNAGRDRRRSDRHGYDGCVNTRLCRDVNAISSWVV